MAKPPKTKSPPRTVALYDQHLGLVLDERYRILAPLGDGVLTTVYSAEHVTLGTRYAVAFLKEEFADQKTVVEAFLNRAKSQPRLSGVHVLSALDFGVAPSGEPYVVKEYGEGETLGDFVKRHGTLTPRRAVALIRQLALVLQELGGEGHRNLKPHNIKVSSEGELLALMDFGHIALHSSAVPRLDPWELWLHKKPELNDVTALSLFAFFLITGRLPERSEFTIPVGEYAPDEQEAFARLERLYSIGRQVVSPGEATMESIVGLLGSDAIPKEPVKNLFGRPAVIVGGGLILALLIVIAGALIIRGRRPNNRTKRLVPVEAPQPPPAMKQLTGKGPIEVKPLESAVPMSPVSASPMDPPVVYSLPFYLRVEPQGSAFSIRGAYQKEGNQYEIRVKGVNPTVVASHKGYHTKTVVISPKKDQIVVISLERITPHFVPMNEPRAGSSELLNPFSDRSNP